MNQNIATLRAASLPAAPCSFDGPVSQPRRTLDPASHAVVLCLLSTVNNKALVPTSSHPCLNAASLRAPVQAALSGKFYESRHIRPPGSLDGCLKSCTRYLVSFRLYTLSNRAVFSFFSRKCLQRSNIPAPPLGHTNWRFLGSSQPDDAVSFTGSILQFKTRGSNDMLPCRPVAVAATAPCGHGHLLWASLRLSC